MFLLPIGLLYGTLIKAYTIMEECEHIDFHIVEVKKGYKQLEVEVYCETCYAQGKETIDLDPEWDK